MTMSYLSSNLTCSATGLVTSASNQRMRSFRPRLCSISSPAFIISGDIPLPPPRSSTFKPVQSPKAFLTSCPSSFEQGNSSTDAYLGANESYCVFSA
ncbi:von Willebrand factor A domain-containing protein 5B1 [Fusarium oxysporum f. sp. albedinis]|nr:von Willebrand factor A domain-containing protein 5B1 [Fusarium oxysporum f. sp. albedinis]